MLYHAASLAFSLVHCPLYSLSFRQEWELIGNIYGRTLIWMPLLMPGEQLGCDSVVNRRKWLSEGSVNLTTLRLEQREWERTLLGFRSFQQIKFDIIHWAALKVTADSCDFFGTYLDLVQNAHFLTNWIKKSPSVKDLWEELLSWDLSLKKNLERTLLLQPAQSMWALLHR